MKFVLFVIISVVMFCNVLEFGFGFDSSSNFRSASVVVNGGDAALGLLSSNDQLQNSCPALSLPEIQNVSTPDFISLLLSDYDRTIDPTSWTSIVSSVKDQPTVLNLHIQYLAVYNVDTQSEQLTVRYELISYWQDCRLRFVPEIDRDSLRISSSKVWMPDLELINARPEENDISYSESISNARNSVTVFHDGYVISRMQLQNRIACQFDVLAFPFDVQRACGIQFRLIQSQLSVLILKPLFNPNSQLQYEHDGTRTIDTDHEQTASPDEWKLRNYTLSTAVIQETMQLANNVTLVNQYSALYAFFDLHRVWTHYMYLFVFPCVILWLTSYFGFYIDPKSAPARVTITVVPLLALVNLHSSLLSYTPRVTYATFISRYIMTTCAACAWHILMYSLINYAILTYPDVMAAAEARRNDDEDATSCMESIEEGDKYLSKAKRVRNALNFRCFVGEWSRMNQKVLYVLLKSDHIMRILAPAAFAITNAIIFSLGMQIN